MPPCVIDTVDAAADGARCPPQLHWLRTPYENTGRLALWFARSVRLERDAVVLASSEYVYKILATTVLFAENGVVRLPAPLWDHTTPGVGDCIRCLSGGSPLTPRTTCRILDCNPQG